MKKILSVMLGVILATANIGAFAEGDIFPKHEPYGQAVGAMPGRVVWSYEPDSVDWNGDGYWWQISNFNEAVIQDMVDTSIASLG